MKNKKIINDIELLFVLKNDVVCKFDINAMAEFLKIIGINISDNFEVSTTKTLKDFVDKTESIFELHSLVDAIDNNIKAIFNSIDFKMFVLQKLIIIFNESFLTKIQYEDIPIYFNSKEQIIIEELERDNIINRNDNYYAITNEAYKKIYDYKMYLKNVYSSEIIFVESVNCNSEYYQRIQQILNTNKYTEVELKFLYQILKSLGIKEDYNLNIRERN